MRTTLQLDEDVYEAARSLAAAEGVSLGAVISRLARLGLALNSRVRVRNGFPVFEVTDEAPAITPETVKRAQDDE